MPWQAAGDSRQRRHESRNGEEILSDEPSYADPLQRGTGDNTHRGAEEQEADHAGSRVFSVGSLRGDRDDFANAIADLQERLERLGYTTGDDRRGVLGTSTTQAVRQFQQARGLRVDGICGSQTWSAIVEAGHHFGDRYLYRKAPMIRGDDVADLQRRLDILGFDAGRVDGIFGDQTAVALIDFQRNVGLASDGILGPATVAELLRVQPLQTERELVALVRDRERLRSGSPTLTGKLIAITEGGGLGAVVSAITRRLTQAGARVLALQDPSTSRSAAAANSASASACVGLQLEPDQHHCVTAYYAGYRYESPGGKRLAQLVQEIVPQALNVPDAGVRGMSIPILRETRMPAILCEIGPAAVVVERGADVAMALTQAVIDWVASPCG